MLGHGARPWGILPTESIPRDGLSLAGYPFERLHPHVHAWAERLRAIPEFAKEVTQLRHSADQLDTVRRTQVGKTLEMIAGF
jgi:hypothetical protein